MPLWLRHVDAVLQRIMTLCQLPAQWETSPAGRADDAVPFDIRMYSQPLFVLTTNSCRNQN
jgi:hypothetical protein